MIARGTLFALSAGTAKGELMAHESDQNRDDRDMLDEAANRPGSEREQIGGTSKEDLRGVADDEEFEEAEDLEDEDLDEEEGEGTI